MIAHALNPALKHPDGAYPFLIANIIPSGLRGVIFAVLFGAIISTVDSLINSTSSLLTLDIYKGLIRKDAADARLLKFARWTGTLFLIFGALWSPIVGRFGSIFSYAQDCWALMLAPIMAVFLLAIFWKRMSKAAAVLALVLAIPMLVIVFLRQFYGVLASVNIFNLSGIVFLLSLVLVVVTSLLTAPPEPENLRTTLWRPNMVLLAPEETEKGFSWWKRAELWFALIVVCFIIIYAVFW